MKLKTINTMNITTQITPQPYNKGVWQGLPSKHYLHWPLPTNKYWQ